MLVVPIKKWLLIIDIPKYIYEMQKRGYNHFEADFDGDTRRLELRRWKRIPLPSDIWECDTCQKGFNNRSALATHQLKLKHDPYAPISEVLTKEQIA